MTIERLEEIETILNAKGGDEIVEVWWSSGCELVAECKRLRGEINAIQGKAKEALDGD